MGSNDWPQVEIASGEVADWLLTQGDECWWTVDGDPELTGRLMLPCPGDELADEFRRIDRPLLVLDPRGPTSAESSRAFDSLAVPDGLDEDGNRLGYPGRVFVLRWKRESEGRDWLLIEDVDSAESAKRDVIASEVR